ncbi:hypothetical protein LPB85_20410 [Chryseobacterium sp. LC2016-27]|uniref:hypothetical protein n=1 Tax=Chryseobacterium sp. LC2016-27 TaxID=2897326 RepID=UPI001E553B8B|nr:hypothetical protein [Chryseobacterium sp. LC2016-27]MCD0457799.1 hypothetical protein [Chryseobacterium sp. LC2016-27]
MANAQSTSDLTGSFIKNTKSPQVTDFIRYGNIPIKKNVGELDLNIPLVSIPTQDGDRINLALSYNASGFIPNKKSGIVGFNWNLNAGGVITRNVVGEADDQMGSPQTLNGINGHYEHGYLVGIKQFGSNNLALPTDNDLLTINPNKLIAAIDNTNDQFYEVRLNGYPNNNSTRFETTSDKYSFSFNGISGKFFIAPDGKIEVTTNEPHKLKIDLSGVTSQPYISVCSPKYESEIIITDEIGNKYYFGKESKNLEYSVFLGQDISGNYAKTPIINSWYQYKTEYQNGEILKYNYQNDKILPDNIYSSFCKAGTNTFWHNIPAYSDLKKFLDLHSTGDNNVAQGHVFSLVKKAYLESIEYQDYKIVLSYSDQENLYKNVSITGSSFGRVKQKKLDNIQIYNNTNVINSIDFGYDIYNTQYPRIFLKTVKENAREPYEFSYDINNAGTTPSPLTFAIDYWGYYNGKTSNDPYFSTPVIFPAVNYLLNGDYQYTSDVREPNFNYSIMYALQSIKYPTKGSSFFEYEPHQYSLRLERRSDNSFIPKLYSVNGTSGGSRIKKIYDFDLNSNQNTREFIYTNDLNQPSGILTEWPRYFFYYNAQISGSFCSGGSGWLNCIPWSSNGSKYIQTASGYSRSLTEGAIISYSKVIEKFSGNGSTTDYFTSYIDKPDTYFDNSVQLTAGNYSPLPAIKNILLMPSDRSIERDKPYRRLTKDETGNLLEERLFQYNENQSRFDQYHISMNISNAWMNPLRNYYYNDFISSSITKKYFGNNVLQTESKYFYENPNHNMLTKIYTSSTDESVQKTLYKYAHEKSNQLMIDKNMIGVPLETETTQTIGSLDTTLSKIETIYPIGLPTSQTGNLVLPLSIKSYDIQNPTVSSTEATYDKYDSKGNLLQYTTKDGISTVIIWGYNGTQPIAKVVGATYAQVSSSASAIITASDSDASNSINEPALITALDNFRKSLPSYQVTTYTYDPLIGVTSITPSSGIRERYIYDTANRLEKIVDVNNTVLKEFKYNYKH